MIRCNGIIGAIKLS